MAIIIFHQSSLSSSLSSKSNTIMMIMNQKRKPLMERSNAVTITLLCWYNKMNNKIYNWHNVTFVTHTPQTKTLLEFFTLNTFCTHQSFYIQTHAPMNVWTIWFFFFALQSMTIIISIRKTSSIVISWISLPLPVIQSNNQSIN